MSVCLSVFICQSQSAVSRHNKLISSNHSELAQPPTAHVQETHTQSSSSPSGSGSSRGPLRAQVTQLTVQEVLVANSVHRSYS
jgi:hypothetical protein